MQPRRPILFIALGIAALLLTLINLTTLGEEFQDSVSMEHFTSEDVVKVSTFMAPPFRGSTFFYSAHWITLLDETAASTIGAKMFKRHMISKYLHGKVAWETMGIIASPGAPDDLLTWAKGLGVTIHEMPVLECNAKTPDISLQRYKLTKLRSWCMTEFESVVFMDLNTVVLGEVRVLPNMCRSSPPAAICGASAGTDQPAYTIDPNVFVAVPSATHCSALLTEAGNATPAATGCEKEILSSYFPHVDRKNIDPRYNNIVFEGNTVHRVDDSIVVQYDPTHAESMERSDVRAMLESIDRDLDSFESQRKHEVPKRVLYITMLTPSPPDESTHSTTIEVFKQHHISKFAIGGIPWENQAIVYTENAFPEFRKWLEDRGGHTIEVPPLFCENGRDARYKYQFTKLQLWNLTDWDVIVYTDLDTLIMGDISTLWSSCIPGVNLCGVEETVYLPKKHYLNGGMLIARPDATFYKYLIESRKTYDKSTFLCEQDYLNYQLTTRRIGVVDSKYNIMSFDYTRQVRFQQAKIVHYVMYQVDNLQGGITPDERDYIHEVIAKVDKIGESYPDPGAQIFQDSELKIVRSETFMTVNSSFSPTILQNYPAPARSVIWLTLLDEESTSEEGALAFKRHMVSKHAYGAIAWENMGVFVTPEAPETLVAWAKDLGVSIHRTKGLSCSSWSVRAPKQKKLTKLQAWCMTDFESVVFMAANTLVTHDVRELVTMCSDAGIGFCGAASASNLPYYRRSHLVPKRVLYATMLTPPPKDGYTHSTSADMFKQHHVSKFLYGNIPWENQAIIYTDNAFPEFRKWLEDRGGHTIEVKPLFCKNGRDKRYRYQFTKLQFWNLTDWDTIVYTDLDTIVVGDISQLWNACVDTVKVCGVEEPRYMPGRRYMNGGLLLARPDDAFYKYLIEGRKTYTQSTWLCEQDYLNYFLTGRRYGVVDPKYNVMGFDPNRKIPFQAARIIHYVLGQVDRLELGITASERDFLHAMMEKVKIKADTYQDPAITKP
ncbi:Galactinol synthase 1 [Hondaea fermentalgiana]|uniref:Galactinol synthase 1 n=1 Tax=Hondaea fermentalgiana TaxID=2315210 RepID=A0A2R5GP58_9STRA|nr:Galactinol synthase 1 [Hondaea fermentalgiana]|eukprot:GBG30101.1 Galactinol synthase 1 [Hondaea fermentalgiana]